VNTLLPLWFRLDLSAAGRSPILIGFEHIHRQRRDTSAGNYRPLLLLFSPHSDASISSSPFSGFGSVHRVHRYLVNARPETAPSLRNVKKTAGACEEPRVLRRQNHDLLPHLLFLVPSHAAFPAGHDATPPTAGLRHHAHFFLAVCWLGGWPPRNVALSSVQHGFRQIRRPREDATRISQLYGISRHFDAREQGRHVGVNIKHTNTCSGRSHCGQALDSRGRQR